LSWMLNQTFVNAQYIVASILCRGLFFIKLIRHKWNVRTQNDAWN